MTGRGVPRSVDIDRLEAQIADLKAELSEARRALPPEQVENHVLEHEKGQVTLSELFGAHTELLVVHNMGRGCSYCTLWADGFNGLLPHIQSRSAFVVVSPDPPDVQREFAEARGWTFPMASSRGSSFSRDLGFETDTHRHPGVSALYKDRAGTIYRTAYTGFGPGDDFCSVWPLFDLLHGGVGDWQPK